MHPAARTSASSTTFALIRFFLISRLMKRLQNDVRPVTDASHRLVVFDEVPDDLHTFAVGTQIFGARPSGNNTSVESSGIDIIEGNIDVNDPAFPLFKRVDVAGSATREDDHRSRRLLHRRSDDDLMALFENSIIGVIMNARTGELASRNRIRAILRPSAGVSPALARAAGTEIHGPRCAGTAARSRSPYCLRVPARRGIR